MKTRVLALFVFVPWIFAAGCNTVSVDVPASDLDVVASVIDEPNPSDGKNICVMQVKHNGSIVDGLVGATITCNGIAMPYNTLVVGFAERIPVQPVGGVYAFVHSRSGVQTTIPLTVPPRPQFTSPTAGANVARSANFSVSYVPGGGEVQVTARHSDHTSNTNGKQPDTGTYVGLDTSAFATGAGSLRLTRHLESILSGTGFQSAASKYLISTQIDVNWQ